MVTDTTEKGLEALITNSLTDNGWLPGDRYDYDRLHCVDLAHLSAFLEATQPDIAAGLDLSTDSTTRSRFLARLKREVGSRGDNRRTPQGNQARPQRHYPVLRDTDTGQYRGRGTLPAKSLLSNPPAPLQHQQSAALSGRRPLRQRPAHRHDGAKEPLHRPDCGRCRGAVQE